MGQVLTTSLPQLFSRVAALLDIPTNNVREFQRLYILTNTCYRLSFFYYSHRRGGGQMESQRSLDYQCHF